MKQNRTIVIAGAHHTPAIEFIHQLQSDPKTNWQIIYISHLVPTDTHINHTIIPQLNIKFIELDCGKYDRKNIDLTLLGIPKTVTAIFKSIKLLSQLKPAVVVSFGSYVSVPVIIAAFFCRLPSITHEQTLTISLATKINSLFATRTAVSFPHPRFTLTGNLLRREIYENSTTSFKNLKLKIKNYPLIYITGGNQGSLFLNNLTYSLVAKLSTKYTLIHQTGKNIDSAIQKKLIQKYPHYYTTAYIKSEDIGWVLNNCQLVISRSGANICQEINALHIPAILVPLPFTQQDEQTKNAAWLKSKLPATTFISPQSTTTPASIISYLSRFPTKSNPAARHYQSNSAVLRLVYEIIS